MSRFKPLCGEFNDQLMRSESPLDLARVAPLRQRCLALRTRLRSLEDGRTIG